MVFNYGLAPKGKGVTFKQEYLAAVESGDRRRIRMCLSKRSYRTEGEAHAVMRVREVKTGKRLRCYECPCCGCYHITSQPDQKLAQAA